VEGATKLKNEKHELDHLEDDWALDFELDDNGMYQESFGMQTVKNI
jgi:hypothetical protein